LGRRLAQVDPEHPPYHDGDQAWRHVAHLRVSWFLPYSDDNDDKQDQDEHGGGEDNQDQRGKHQLPAPLPMI
jgi:hypothetical protein